MLLLLLSLLLGTREVIVVWAERESWIERLF
jgi:hypothetical protein